MDICGSEVMVVMCVRIQWEINQVGLGAWIPDPLESCPFFALVISKGCEASEVGDTKGYMLVLIICRALVVVMVRNA